MILPTEAPKNISEIVHFKNSDGKKFEIRTLELENLLSPTLVICQGRNAALVPIRRSFADELLGTNRQPWFDFISNKDASFFSHRCYVNSPRSASVMRPERPILFYESMKEKGRGAVIAIARIVDAIVVGKDNIPNERLRRLVVDDVDGFSASHEVLLTTFDNLFEIPCPVPFSELRRNNIVDGANLVAPITLTGEQVSLILNFGAEK